MNHQKQKSANSSTTLDKKHKEYLDKFHKTSDVTIPRLLNEKKNLKVQLKKKQGIDNKLDIIDKIKEINVTMKLLKDSKRVYLLDNSELIFRYFEDKMNIGNTEKEVQNKSTIVKRFFGLPTHNDKNTPKPLEASTVVNQYLSNVDDDFIDLSIFTKQSDVCEKCEVGQMIAIEDEGQMLCNVCFSSNKFLVEYDKPCYKEPPNEICFYAYKRINHFKEILSQFQGKETTQIPHEVLLKIKLQIKKERIDLTQVTNLKTKEILKKLGYNKYYEHIPFIKDKLGIKPPVMTIELEETLCNLFVELQSPYAKYCPDDRVNFLNYYYTAYKLCELLGETTYINHFPMLKDREKRIEQDEIWKNICSDLNWVFIPTVI
jgi:hypothetical protein|tara:strand:- start:1182 stop:2303 length:1122 start_codon:yes stop_codon:yes gene_type:complete